MPDPRTTPAEFDPATFVAALEPAARRSDAEALLALFGRVSGEVPRIWGSSIVGYGSYHYRYASGREGDAPRIGFSSRKAKHVLYLLGCGEDDARDVFEPLLARLGKYTRGVGCLYVNKLADADMGVLEEVVRTSWTRSFGIWPDS